MSVILRFLFIIICVINIVLLSEKNKFRKVTIVVYVSSLIYGITSIVFMNIYYNLRIPKVILDSKTLVENYLEMVKDFNLTYILWTLGILAILFLISITKFRVSYDVLYYITFALLVVSHIYLFFTKCIVIVKGYDLDMSGLSASLKWSYLNFITLPLFIFKYKKEN